MKRTTCSRKVACLTSVSVQFLTVFAEPVAAITVLAFRVGNIPTGRASPVVVVDTVVSWLLDFVD
jgi:hypothetical protein